MLYRVRARRLELEYIRRARRADAIAFWLEGVTIGLVAVGGIAYALAFCGALKPLLG